MTGENGVNQRDEQLWAMPPIMQQFPIVFANGFRFEEINFICNQCGCEIDGRMVRGAVNTALKRVASIEAVGACVDCKVATRFLYRLHDDERVTGLSGNQWGTWLPERTLFEKLKEKWHRCTSR